MCIALIKIPNGPELRNLGPCLVFFLIFLLKINDTLSVSIFFLNLVTAYSGGDLLPPMAVNMSLIDLLFGFSDRINFSSSF